MHRCLLIAGLLLTLSLFVAGQQETTNPPAPAPSEQTAAPAQPPANQPAASQAQQPANIPSGTTVERHEREAVVAPQAKPVKITPSVITAAQKELRDRGYHAGPIDGQLGPETQDAIRRFQADNNLTQTGRLDAPTLGKLHVGGPQVIGAAPADLGRGGKAIGHNVKEGHPVDAGKAGVEGTKNFGKKVGHGSKSLALEGTKKVGKGISAIGGKITGKTEGTDKDKGNQQPQGESQPR